MYHPHPILRAGLVLISSMFLHGCTTVHVYTGASEIPAMTSYAVFWNNPMSEVHTVAVNTEGFGLLMGPDRFSIGLVRDYRVYTKLDPNKPDAENPCQVVIFASDKDQVAAIEEMLKKENSEGLKNVCVQPKQE